MRFIFSLLILVFGVWIVAAPGQSRAVDISGEYRIVDSSKPGGGGSYGGKLTVTPAGAAYKFQWTLDDGDSHSGPAIMLNGVVGAGYGEGLTGLAVYEIKGKTLRARWLLASAPTQVGDYTMSGPAALNGSYKFTNGVPGSVTIKPNGNTYDMLWNLSSGSFPGIGIRVGDVLVAVSGTPGTAYGVAAYHAVAKDRIAGVWADSGQTELGVEDLGPLSAPENQAASSDVRSAGEPPAAKSAETPATSKTRGKPAELSNEELAAKIAVDYNTAGGIADNFLNLLKADKFEDAAALIVDEGFKRMHTTRKDFLARLQQVRQTEGAVVTFVPDQGKPDFGAEKGGGMYFVLAVDSKYEKSTARETLRFLRFPDGKVKMVGYEHTTKAAGQ